MDRDESNKNKEVVEIEAENYRLKIRGRYRRVVFNIRGATKTSVEYNKEQGELKATASAAPIFVPGQMFEIPATNADEPDTETLRFVPGQMLEIPATNADEPDTETLRFVPGQMFEIPATNADEPDTETHLISFMQNAPSFDSAQNQVPTSLKGPEMIFDSPGKNVKVLDLFKPPNVSTSESTMSSIDKLDGETFSQEPSTVEAEAIQHAKTFVSSIVGTSSAEPPNIARYTTNDTITPRISAPLNRADNKMPSMVKSHNPKSSAETQMLTLPATGRVKSTIAKFQASPTTEGNKSQGKSIPTSTGAGTSITKDNTSMFEKPDEQKMKLNIAFLS
uniref:uncharacterized protein LOC113474132 isoform X1 n=1 Tax=Ciona intestinalis TaxID=7719 RepID=UPI000EF50B5D|nr:uncharacterized protein LOC113474132 isoform X1 [Ciona intestinalis]|eukprot:XP_026689685.1 uncharacterized protein LOC113474132 isoform X1 [Ciona intestinalis]